LRIPQFQREFVWDKPRIIKLLESIYLEYPIGSFFFWDAPRKYYDFYRDIAEKIKSFIEKKSDFDYRNIIKQYSFEKMTNKTVKIYQEVLYGIR